MEEGNKKKTFQLLIFILTFVVAFIGTKYVMSTFNSTKSKLEKASLEINKKCPIMLDKETRLESTNVIQNKMILYNCTLINNTREDLNFDAEIISNKFELKAQRILDTNPDMKEFREQEIILCYNYKDKKGVNLFGFTVTSSKK